MSNELTEKLTRKIKANTAKKARRRKMEQAIANRQFIVWDGGRNICTVIIPTDDGFISHKISKQDFIELNIPGLKAGMVLVGEEAHHRARNVLSLAHVFEYDELVELQKNAQAKGVQLFMSPQDISSLVRTRQLGNGFKACIDPDEEDCRAWAQDLIENPHLTVDQLREFVPIKTEDHQQRILSVYAYRQGLNRDMQIGKTLKYDDPDNQILVFINENIKAIYDVLTEDERALLGFKITYKGRSIAKGHKNDERIDCNETRLYPLVATLLTREGDLRLRSDTGKLPHWKWVADIGLGIQGSHRKAGCAAAAYKYYLRHLVSRFTMLFEDGSQEWQEDRLEYAKTNALEPKDPHQGRVKRSTDLNAEADKRFRFARAEVDKSIRSIWRKLRELVINSHG